MLSTWKILRTENVCLCLALVGCLLVTSPVKCPPPDKLRDDCRPRKQNKPAPEDECVAALEPSLSYYGKFKYDLKCTGITCDYRHDCGRAPLNTIRGNNFLQYIINGKPQRYGNWPSFATLKHTYYRQVLNRTIVDKCGGVIVSPRHILTANHCTLDAIDAALLPIPNRDLTVVLGDDTVGVDPHETTYSVVSVCRDKRYVEQSENGFPIYDYAVLTLNTSIEFDHYKRPACLPYKLDYNPPAGQSMPCYLMGWGAILVDKNKTSPSRIMDSPVTATTCLPPFKDSESTMCLKKADKPGSPCHNDSGSPILCKNPRSHRWTVIGLVSHGNGSCEQGTDWQFGATKITTLLNAIKTECKI